MILAALNEKKKKFKKKERKNKLQYKLATVASETVRIF